MQCAPTYSMEVTDTLGRSASDTDPNTRNLRDIISRYQASKASIQEVDLANLSAVHEFASKISAGIANGQYPPLKSIICNAFYWNLVSDSELTVDGYDKTLQIGHIAHVALILRLIGRFASDGGRIVLVSSIAHYRVKTYMSPYLPEIPDNIDQLLRPAPDKDKQGRGFQRYASSKLVHTIWMYPLNRYLQQADDGLKNPRLKDITAVAINPGGLGDSRSFITNTPGSIQFMQKYVLKPLMPLVKCLVDPTFRSSAEAGVDLVELATDRAHPGERGYFTLLQKDTSDPLTLDETVQQNVWLKSAEWAGITKENTELKDALE
ncbi:hypothetical protein DL769_010797 [Monosporascus sp. CRB-8-3]|nr:hypothetical protein DL769_010797 [Monosporascus sp. CRB-8-3]